MSDSNTPPLWLQVPKPHDLVKRYGAAVDVPAFGGRLEVDWSPGERVTSVGGLVFFATFLRETGLFDRLCEDFPISYTSNNSCSKRDIAGTAVLAILLGKTRYVHIEAIRHDEAARELLVRLLAKHGGLLDRRGLICSLHIDHLTFRRIVMTLHMCDAIIEESECGKTRCIR